MTIISRIEVKDVEETEARIKCRTDRTVKMEISYTSNPTLPVNEWSTIETPYARRYHYFNLSGLLKGTDYTFFLQCDSCNITGTTTFSTTGSADPDPGPGPGPDPEPEPQEFVMSNKYFDGTGAQYGLWEDTDDLDIKGPMTWMIWFRRDTFNLQQFFLSKGHWEDELGWRMMVKQTKPPYQYEQIQFDVGDGTDLNYYKSNKGVTDSKDHFAAMVFNPNVTYVDSKGVDTHGYVCLDGNCDDYYMARSNTSKPPITTVKPYRAPMYLGRHFCEGKFYFSGMIYDVQIVTGDPGKEGVTKYYDDTKHLYNI